MADLLEGAEESFTLEDLEISEVEQFVALPNIDNINSGTCRGHCLREKRRNFCPCRSLNNFCSRACHGEDFGQCMNNRRVQESDSDNAVSLLFFYFIHALCNLFLSNGLNLDWNLCSE